MAARSTVPDDRAEHLRVLARISPTGPMTPQVAPACVDAFCRLARLRLICFTALGAAILVSQQQQAASLGLGKDQPRPEAGTAPATPGSPARQGQPGRRGRPRATANGRVYGRPARALRDRTVPLIHLNAARLADWQFGYERKEVPSRPCPARGPAAGADADPAAHVQGAWQVKVGYKGSDHLGSSYTDEAEAQAAAQQLLQRLAGRDGGLPAPAAAPLPQVKNTGCACSRPPQSPCTAAARLTLRCVQPQA